MDVNLTLDSLTDKNEADDESDEMAEISVTLRTWKYASTIVMIFCCLFGFCGNTISSFIFLHSSMRSSPINFLLASISIIDLIVLALIAPTLILPGMNFYFQNYQVYRFYLIVVLVVYPIVVMSQTASTWTYVLVVVERYVAVCQPLKTYKLLTTGQAKKTQSIIVLVAICYNFTRFWEYRRSDDGHVEEFLRANEFYFLFYYAALHLVTHFLVPLSIIVVLNFRIIRTLTNPRKRQLPLRRCATNAAFNIRRQHRTAWMIVVATGAFVLTNVGVFFVNIWEAFEPDVLKTDGPWTIYVHAASDLANILLTSHSACSFFVYMIFCRQYRCLFRRLMTLAKLRVIRFLCRRSEEDAMMDWRQLGNIDARYSPTDDADGRVSVYRTRTLSTLASFIHH